MSGWHTITKCRIYSPVSTSAKLVLLQTVSQGPFNVRMLLRLVCVCLCVYTWAMEEWRELASQKRS